MRFAGLRVLTPTRSGLSSYTNDTVRALCREGANATQLGGCSDVALARNLLYSEALASFPEDELWLLLDDDISVGPDDVARMVKVVRGRGRGGVSAVYPTAQGGAAASQPVSGHWRTGLGCMVVCVESMRDWATRLPLLEAQNKKHIRPFCQSRISRDDREWLSEDYWFCDHLPGGVLLVNVCARHLKPVMLAVDPATISTFGEDGEVVSVFKGAEYGTQVEKAG